MKMRQETITIERRQVSLSTTQKTSMAQESADTVHLSLEQQAIVHTICQLTNVVVPSKAGCGKTTVSLATAQAFYQQHGRRTLLLTYNSRLKTETRQRIQKLGLESVVEAHSYHAAALRFAREKPEIKSVTDELIHQVLLAGEEAWEPLDFGLVIVDECQDMTELYYRFTLGLIQACPQKPVLLLLGDIFQRLYSFHGATDRYLTDSTRYFGPWCHTPHFQLLPLSISWRITHEMAEFINEYVNPLKLQHAVSPAWWQQNYAKLVAFWGPGIRASPQRGPAPDSVEWIEGALAKAHDSFTALYTRYPPDQISMICYSNRGENSPANRFMAQVGENWRSVEEEPPADTSPTSPYYTVGTIHKFKGLERSAILYVSLSAYLEDLHPDDPLEHFNLHYVACTRAKDRLLVHLPHIKQMKQRYATMRPADPTHNTRAVVKLKTSVPRLLQYTPFDAVLSIGSQILQTIVIGEDSTPLRADPHAFRVSSEHGTWENLAPYMSQVIALSFRLSFTGSQLEVKNLTEGKLAEYYPDSLCRFLTETQVIAAQDFVGLFRYILAEDVTLYGSIHLWNRLAHLVLPGPMLEYLGALHEGVQRLVDAWIRYENVMGGKLSKQVFTLSWPFEWWTNRYQPELLVPVDLVYEHTDQIWFLAIESTDVVEIETGLQLQAAMSCFRLQHPGETRKLRAALILPRAGRVVEVMLQTQHLVTDAPLHDFELIQRICRRRLDLPVQRELFMQEFRTFSEKKISVRDSLLAILQSVNRKK